MKFVYRRVSTTEQNLDRQLPDMPFKETEDCLVFSDKKSGKDFEREGWKDMCNRLHRGDELYIHSLDRMGRNLLEILKEIAYLVKEKGVSLHIVKDNIHLEVGKEVSAMVELQLNIMGAVAQMERKLIKERQKEGITAAKARGVHCGRPAKGLRRVEVDEKAVLAALAEGQNVSAVARNFNITRAMVYRIKAAH